MTAELVGTIEPEPGSSAGKDQWIALISAHPALTPVAPKQGTNSFSKKLMTYSPSPDAATVIVDDTEVGANSLGDE